jgi:8-oxo-dGTP diphosphatase
MDGVFCSILAEVVSKPEVQRLAAYALIVKDGKMLLCRLTSLTGSAGMWTLPGGKVEFGEHPDNAVVREVLEETGLTVSNKGVLTVNSELFHFTGTRMHAVRLIYRVQVVSGTLTYEQGGTTDICEWFTPDEARKLPLVSLAKLGVKLVREHGLI